ncbi:MAG: hypothetical protein JW827_09630 [Spirochaetes bacterium]|nr:hypothetical protein [Spirochaetota bacterium]
MKRGLSILTVILTVTLMILTLDAAKYKPADTFTEKNPLVIFDFDERGSFNNIGGMYGVFDANPNDREAYCRMSNKRDKDLHNKGYYLKIKYDVDSSQAAFNGLWAKMNGINISKFGALGITIKGDSKDGFNDFFKVELKTKDTKIESYLEDITDKWQKIVIPFEDFEGDIEDFDWSNLAEFTMVFEDWRFKSKTGTYYIDDIVFIPKKGATVKYEDVMAKPGKQDKKEKKK